MLLTVFVLFLALAGEPQKVDGKLVKTGEDLRASLDRKDGKPSLLLVHRKDATIFLTLASK